MKIKETVKYVTIYTSRILKEIKGISINNKKL